MIRFAHALIIIILIMTMMPLQASARSKILSDNIIEEEVAKAIFDIEDTGKVVVILPSQLTEKDTFSGTVVYEPFGKDKASKLSNLKLLEVYSVEIRRAEILKPDPLPEEYEKKGLPAPEASKKSPTFVGTIPEKCKTLEICLIEGERKKKYERIKLNDPEEVKIADSKSCSIPQVAQGNHPVVVKGAFDGNFKNTKITMDKSSCQILAESPRETIFKSPLSLVGKSRLDIEEETFSASAHLVNLKLRLEAKKLNLKMGEKTSLYAKVEGIQDTNSAVELVLVNMTPEVVSLVGGDNQVVRIPLGGRK